MISGPPDNICIAPANVAQTILRPPSRQAAWVSQITQGSQLKPAMLLGHIKKFRVNPLKAKMTPANAAAHLLPVQRCARWYIPNPPQNWCARQKIESDHGNGSSK